MPRAIIPLASEGKWAKLISAWSDLADWLDAAAEKVIGPEQERKRWHARADLCRRTAQMFSDAEVVPDEEQPSLLEEPGADSAAKPPSGFDTGGKR